MNDRQWDQLLRVIDGEVLDPMPVGFLVDAPWISRFADMSMMEYFSNSHAWYQANLAVMERFPEVFWMPGFWAEFGMISNPPSFGAKCIWPPDGFPSCEPVLRNIDEIATLCKPNVQTDGLLPLIMQRLRACRHKIEAAGHRIRFACSHGPITIASYLVGHNEFFLACRTERDAIRELLDITTQFVMDWLVYQQNEFSSIDGILVLEDLMGFVGQDDFEQLVLPVMKRVFAAMPVTVRFLHNDAFGLITARYLDAMEVNLFNFSFEHDVADIRKLAGERVTLLGNIPPRDILGQGTAQQVEQAVTGLLAGMPDQRRMICSAGGFTPAEFSADKIQAFCRAAGYRC